MEEIESGLKQEGWKSIQILSYIATYHKVIIVTNNNCRPQRKVSMGLVCPSATPRHRAK